MHTLRREATDVYAVFETGDMERQARDLTDVATMPNCDCGFNIFFLFAEGGNSVGTALPRRQKRSFGRSVLLV